MFKKMGTVALGTGLLFAGISGNAAQVQAQAEANQFGFPGMWAPGWNGSSQQEEVENVIYMIPDGFNAGYATNYRWYKGEEAVWDQHLKGMFKTKSSNSRVTDSAAAGTAMATGHKTQNGVVGLDAQGNEVQTILEAAEENDKSSGLVATSSITHATPASFASHVESRDNQTEIARQMLANDVDVMLGGGKDYFLPESEGGLQAEENLLQQARESDYQHVETSSELTNADDVNVNEGEKLLGLFAGGAMSPELQRSNREEPSLSDMTSSAIETLDSDQDGFFLMVEGSQIDWAGHANDAGWAMSDTAAFEQAVEEAISYAEEDGNTLVVVAGDHETGGMSVGANGEGDVQADQLQDVQATGEYMAGQLNEDRSNARDVLEQYTSFEWTEENITAVQEADNPTAAINTLISDKALIGWTTSGHTGVDIPVYAYGPQSDAFSGLLDNTELPGIMAEAMNITLGGNQ
ncbi:alkaline phosphatase [Salibacterium halotolerans]|uniref:Alkaline phosphatase n=1 Tax=Salibacterium halotolerans TaxID=1884432 RepID=A0A1I5TLC9_9BACI|nr:alkaline phosphatase [Salibacterium halotolerans]SFP83869.1 alkaline phosphatase [Salibacterium halotolerans]